MLDKDTIDVITKLNDDQNKYFEKLLESKEKNDNLKFKGIHKNIDAGFEAFKIEMKSQNGRLTKLEDETHVFRLIHRNPKASVIIGGFCIFGIIAFFILKNVIL